MNDPIAIWILRSLEIERRRRNVSPSRRPSVQYWGRRAASTLPYEPGGCATDRQYDS